MTADVRNSKEPFYKVSAWPFAMQLLALVLALAALGMTIGRLFPEPVLDPGFSAGNALPDLEVLSQLRDLQAEEPIGNTKLEFREFNRVGTNEDLGASGTAVLLANFEGPHAVDRVRFELYEGSQVAGLRLAAYEDYGRTRSEDYEVLNPPMGTWANFCLNSEIFGVECFARVENAVIRGRIIDDEAFEYPDLKKIDAGILVNVGVKYWMGIFGPTKDTS